MSADIDAIRERWRPVLDEPRRGDGSADVATLLAALDASQREAERLRGQLTAMHRRAQRAEGIADRVAADRPQGAHGRSVGRALANYAAHRAAQERDEARAEVERLRSELDQTRRAARAELLAEIEAREPGTDADVRVALLLDAVADARRGALEEAIRVCEDRCKTAAETSDRLAAEAGQAGDDARWRDRLTAAHVAGAIATTARQIGDALRALLDAPAPAREGA